MGSFVIQKAYIKRSKKFVDKLLPRIGRSSPFLVKESCFLFYFAQSFENVDFFDWIPPCPQVS